MALHVSGTVANHAHGWQGFDHVRLPGGSRPGHAAEDVAKCSQKQELHCIAWWSHAGSYPVWAKRTSASATGWSTGQVRSDINGSPILVTPFQVVAIAAGTLNLEWKACLLTPWSEYQDHNASWMAAGGLGLCGLLPHRRSALFLKAGHQTKPRCSPLRAVMAGVRAHGAFQAHLQSVTNQFQISALCWVCPRRFWSLSLHASLS